MTIRSHDQFNTTIYGFHDRYRGVHGGRRVLFMNPADIAARGWSAATRVDITSHFHGERRMARRFQLVAYDIPRRCVAAYYPEANVLVPIGSVADGEQHADLQVDPRHARAVCRGGRERLSRRVKERSVSAGMARTAQRS